ncbi:acyl carrier protein [Pseudomonas protegens]|nr:acyl carrier protein [Pseudomonas protegens]PYC03601.1 acyl carrier protein [Pseudomonas protegens]
MAMPWPPRHWWEPAMCSATAVPLQTQVMDDVLGLCARLLKVAQEQLHAGQNFFAIGGSSLQALQLCALLEQLHPQLCGEDGIDLTLIVGTATLGEFVAAVLQGAAGRRAGAICEGEL